MSVGGDRVDRWQVGDDERDAQEVGPSAEIDGGARTGVTSAEAERVKALERENRELRRANEILKAASIFFARELDPQPPKR